MRGLDDGREGQKHARECGDRMDRDLEAQVCTRARASPIGRITERLRCPRCSCWVVSVTFSLPNNPQVDAAAARPYRQWRVLDESGS